MHRFFVIPFQSKDNLIDIDGSIAHQIKNVLRAKIGDTFILLDNSGNEYEVALKTIEKTGVLLELKNKRKAKGEPFVRINLYQSLLKREKFEFVLQKGTEIGVASFIPVIAHRSIPVYKKATYKKQRWLSIIKEAAEQSGRGILPELYDVVPFQEACRKAKGFSLIFWEEEKRRSLQKALKTYSPQQGNSINIFIGPEGGFTKEEVELAAVCGISTVSLGARILRSETSAIVAAANILYHLEPKFTQEFY